MMSGSGAGLVDPFSRAVTGTPSFTLMFLTSISSRSIFSFFDAAPSSGRYRSEFIDADASSSAESRFLGAFESLNINISGTTNRKSFWEGVLGADVFLLRDFFGRSCFTGASSIDKKLSSSGPFEISRWTSPCGKLDRLFSSSRLFPNIGG
uniref:(northern house mosquito) hypothetical protein n=1 Tax=Culex pipiens TaxID=7175 RepID=A0A8D8FJQ4_CULPI